MSVSETNNLKRRYEDAFEYSPEEGPEQKRQCCSKICHEAVVQKRPLENPTESDRPLKRQCTQIDQTLTQLVNYAQILSAHSGHCYTEPIVQIPTVW